MQNQKPDFSVAGTLLPPINSEGVRFGVIALVLSFIVLSILMWLYPLAAAILAIPLLSLSYGVFLFFRDPERYPPDDDARAILSPADGRVCLIQEVPWPEELLDENPPPEEERPKFWRVSVFMSVLNVHVNRMPTAASIVKKAYVEGAFLNASLDKASKDNERCAYLMETAEGVRYAVVQIAGLVAKRIVPFVEEGALLSRAERFGLIRFGSRLDVYLPADVKPEVRIGQIMVAGETVLGHLT